MRSFECFSTTLTGRPLSPSVSLIFSSLDLPFLPYDDIKENVSNFLFPLQDTLYFQASPENFSVKVYVLLLFLFKMFQRLLIFLASFLLIF